MSDIAAALGTNAEILAVRSNALYKGITIANGSNGPILLDFGSEDPRRALLVEFDDLRIDRGGGARIELGLERAQQGLDRIEINPSRDRVKPRSELVENRVQPPRADPRISEPIKFVADFDKYRLKRLGVGGGAAGGGELRVKIVQEPFDWPGVDRRTRERLKRLADLVDTARQVVERAGIDRCGSVGAGECLIKPRGDLLQAPLDCDERGRGR